jgi:hypothetical protein
MDGAWPARPTATEVAARYVDLHVHRVRGVQVVGASSAMQATDSPDPTAHIYLPRRGMCTKARGT